MKFGFLLFLAVFACAAQAHEESTIVITNLTAAELFEGLEHGDFDVLVDVRSAEEYATGHIANATLMADLAVEGFPSATPDDLAGCENCRVAVYCSTGARAAVAATHLVEAGFHVLYNGGGVTQWTAAGYPLVTGTDSVVPPCTVDTTASEQCTAATHSEEEHSSFGNTHWDGSKFALVVLGVTMLLM
ncbi:hypothetical protein FisN_9Lh291 [Fistulifera solaris]|uniref:Rhodanese domain-containing protein n=1 Tax=Fistulifera solaris TaxID=1519565 RepID=A0A1Z5KLI3_FISSO|nr:hypothetical protein FisN_9Lh291 [Fistulifera solaris]|eukprot:GAX26985.1 hypothetical protein FisN_9Lh291 [Fistulifera solaris]